MKLTLKNGFHSTEIVVHSKDFNDPKEYYEFLCFSKCLKDQRKLKKIQKILCGIDDCSCGIVNRCF